MFYLIDKFKKYATHEEILQNKNVRKQILFKLCSLGMIILFFSLEDDNHCEATE